MPIIRDFLSDLLTFDISVGPGPIAANRGINWEFSISNELNFYQPGQNGYADGGFSNSFDIGVTSTSIARDIAVGDSFDFFFEKRGGLIKGQDGIKIGVQNEATADYDSWRDTSLEAGTGVQFGVDGENRDFDFGFFAAIDTEVFGNNFVPGLELDFYTF
ncbi:MULTISPECIES: hypothetical protein [Paracoccaceae]|uniref:Uncharacterized protein n=1 Tax=Marinibacterium profundimaris TaxID=1679460 RepID=A0A225NDL4_9RHOB|nr:hypothetical protein [Marinibacterium profundimaris]OWU69994.1 hypothetical protein ATO3_21205 [Marinibacterium profundimaris]